MTIKEDTNMMRVTGLVCTPDPDDPSNGMYPPMLTQAEIDAIPSDEIQPGGIVFNTDTEQLETYTADEEWVAVITDGGEFDTVKAQKVETVTLTQTGLAAMGSVTAETLTVTDDISGTDMILSGTLTTQDFVLNGTATMANLQVTDDVIVEGPLTVVGLSLLQDLRIGSFINGGTLAGSTDANAISHITATPGAAVGTGSTITIEGSPISGTITILTGTGATDGTAATFTLPNSAWKQFSAPWGVVLTAASHTASGGGGAGLRWYVFDQTLADANTAATFRLEISASTALSDSTAYAWNYLIIGNSDTA